MTLRVLLVGAGRAGMVHGRNFAGGIPGARLAGVADPDPAARERAGAELGCEVTLADPVAAAGDGAFDAVVIASPTFTHAEVAVTALRAGKHVLCEKPLAISLAEAAEVEAAAAASAGAFVMGFMRRSDAGFARAKERVDAGDVGEPVLVRSTTRGPGLPPAWALDPRRSAGLAAEVNSHDLDTVRWLTGQEYRDVHAVGRAAKRPDLAEAHPGFVDVLAATFELDRGAIGQVDGACPADYGYDARAEVYGTEGALFVGDPRTGGPLLVRAGGAVADPVRSWRSLFAEAYRAEAAHLVAVAWGEAEPRATVTDGARALAAALALNEAIATGRTVSVEQPAASRPPNGGGTRG